MAHYDYVPPGTRQIDGKLVPLSQYNPEEGLQLLSEAKAEIEHLKIELADTNKRMAELRSQAPLKLRQEIKELTETVSVLQAEIDKLRSQLEAKKK